MSTKNKVAVVTGARCGIGKAICELLVQNSINIAICSRDINGLAETAGHLKNLNPEINVFYKSVDITIESEVINFIESTKNNLGKIDILINNAGTAASGLIESTELKDWNNVINTNLTGLFIVTKYAIPAIKESTGGHIINISSIAGITPFENLGAYCASKFAVKGFSEVLRKELSQYNIPVTIIYPGAVATDIWQNINRDADQSKMISPEEVAQSVLFAIKTSNSAHIHNIELRPKSDTL